MNLFDAYKTDKKAENEGVWVPFPNVDVKVKLARAGGANKEWEIAREKALRPLRRRYRDRQIPESEILDALIEPFCKIIIQDWEGVERDGKVLDCSYKHRFDVCNELPEFYLEMLNEAGRMENYQAVEDVEDAGKSPPGSSGTTVTEMPQAS